MCEASLAASPQLPVRSFVLVLPDISDVLHLDLLLFTYDRRTNHMICYTFLYGITNTMRCITNSRVDEPGVAENQRILAAES